jgi:hypothetical protein
MLTVLFATLGASFCIVALRSMIRKTMRLRAATKLYRAHCYLFDEFQFGRYDESLIEACELLQKCHDKVRAEWLKV